MGEHVCVLVVYDIFDHIVYGPNLVITKRYIDSAFTILVLVEYGEFIAKVFFVMVAQELFDRPAIEGEICNHILNAQLEEHFEEYLGVGLILYQCFNIALCLARVNTLNQQEFPQSNLKDLDFEYVIEIRLPVFIFPLILEADLAFVIKLTGEEQMVSLLDFEVVART